MEQLRKEGNELFKCGDYEGALTAYTQALGLGATPQDQAILHRNRAACHLKLVREPTALPLPCHGPVSPSRCCLGPGWAFTFPGHHTGLMSLGPPGGGESSGSRELPCCPASAGKGR